MNFLNKFKSYILPEEIDFFGSLKLQCQITEDIVGKLVDIYISKSEGLDALSLAITSAKQMRIKNLIELNRVLITPVDKEAIARVYINLHWVVLSIKHFDAEVRAYQINDLKEYESILCNLKGQMKQMSMSFELLRKGQHDAVLENIYGVIHLDNLLIEEYADLLSTLFDSSDLKYIMQHKEILSQLKEVSKRIHFCVNSIEDIIFKIN